MLGIGSHIEEANESQIAYRPPIPGGGGCAPDPIKENKKNKNKIKDLSSLFLLSFPFPLSGF
jgi:hypothetical protein